MTGQRRAGPRPVTQETRQGCAYGPDCWHNGSLRECDRLRRYIAVNIVGDNPPPLTAEARDLIRATFGTDHAEGTSATA